MRSQRFSFHLHNFNNLNLNENIGSPTFSFFGCQWKLQLRKTKDGGLIDYVKMDLTLVPQVPLTNLKINGKFQYLQVNRLKSEPDLKGKVSSKIESSQLDVTVANCCPP